jgi:predicted SnoaL-like aldol condensation-catalyzing enzyme
MAVGAALFPSSSSADGAAAPHNENEALVLKAMTRIFIDRDASAIDEYWSKSYVQHNPGIADGPEQLRALVKALPAKFHYEPGFIASNGDIVMIHGRYGEGSGRPSVTVDIFRVEGGKLAEHWDVSEGEVPAQRTKSRHPMFSPDEGR